MLIYEFHQEKGDCSLVTPGLQKSHLMVLDVIEREPGTFPRRFRIEGNHAAMSNPNEVHHSLLFWERADDAISPPDHLPGSRHFFDVSNSFYPVTAIRVFNQMLECHSAICYADRHAITSISCILTLMIDLVFCHVRLHNFRPTESQQFS